MRKIIIAICGIMMFGGAFCVPSHYAEPKEKSKFSTQWKVVGTYNKNVQDKELYKDYLPNQMCYNETEDKDCTVHDGDGTYHDEKAVVLHIARKIYENGAEFCTIQVQPGNSKGVQYVWLDYYHKDGIHACYTYCKPGCDPDNKCEKIENNTDESCDYSYKFPFTAHELITGGGDTDNGRFTKDMAVFSYDNETGGGVSNQPAGNQTTKHRVLGIIKQIQNGVVVAPIEITGWRTKTGSGIESWIKNITTNDNITILCAPGFVLQGDNCVLTPKCKQEQEDAENNAIRMCDGYGYFDETQHTIKIQDTVDNKCRYYRCKESNYGFEKNNHHKCIPCGETKKSGVLHGNCIKCEIGELFDKNEMDGCKLAKKITKDKMWACFMKTDPDEFGACVNN